MRNKKIIYSHVPKANLILEKSIKFQVNIISLSKVMIFLYLKGRWFVPSGPDSVRYQNVIATLRFCVKRRIDDLKSAFFPNSKIMISTKELKQVKLTVFLVKLTVLARYKPIITFVCFLPFLTSFYVFSLNVFCIFPFNNWLAKLHWRLVTCFDWLRSDVTLVTLVKFASFVIFQ